MVKNTKKVKRYDKFSELREFADSIAEKRGVDKKLFVWSVICLCDFLRKKGYELVYTKGNKNNEANIDISDTSTKR